MKPCKDTEHDMIVRHVNPLVLSSVLFKNGLLMVHVECRKCGGHYLGHLARMSDEAAKVMTEADNAETANTSTTNRT